MDTTVRTPTTLKAPAVAVPTIVLTSTNLVLYAIVVALAIAGALPLLVAAAINSVLAYVAYTAMHESVHRNVDRKRSWLNTTIGMFGALPLYHNVELHKLTHLNHHAHLNNPDKDTDHWVAASNPVTLLAKCSTLFIIHYIDGIKLARQKSDSGARLRRALIQNTITLAPIIAVGILVSWRVALIVQVVPGLVAGLTLGVTFDWLPHHPHASTDPREGTRIITARGIWNYPLTWVTLYQNYHQAHHIRPTIPFYLYRQQHEGSVEQLDHAELELS